MKKFEEIMKKFEENVKKYEEIILPIYIPWDLEKFQVRRHDRWGVGERKTWNMSNVKSQSLHKEGKPSTTVFPAQNDLPKH